MLQHSATTTIVAITVAAILFLVSFLYPSNIRLFTWGLVMLLYGRRLKGEGKIHIFTSSREIPGYQYMDNYANFYRVNHLYQNPNNSLNYNLSLKTECLHRKNNLLMQDCVDTLFEAQEMILCVYDCEPGILTLKT